jgi:hypothetical protein
VVDGKARKPNCFRGNNSKSRDATFRPRHQPAARQVFHFATEEAAKISQLAAYQELAKQLAIRIGKSGRRERKSKQESCWRWLEKTKQENGRQQCQQQDSAKWPRLVIGSEY